MQINLKDTETKSHEGRSLLFSYAGFILPASLGVFLLPILVGFLGPERFSLFTTLFVIGIFLVSLDFGISASITRQTSKALATKNQSYASEIIGTGLSLMFVLGIIIFFGGMAVNEIYLIKNINLELVSIDEFNWAFIAICFGVIPTLLTSALRGGLEGRQIFIAASILRILSGSIALVAPIILAFFVTKLDYIFWFIAILRTLIFIIAFFKTKLILQIPNQSEILNYKRSVFRQLLQYGLWVSVGHIIAGLIVTGIIDRLLLSSVLLPDDILSFSIPKDIIARVLLIPSAISLILLPKLVELFINQPLQDIKCQIFNFYILQIAPFCFFLSAIGPELLIYITANNVSSNSPYLFDVFLLSLLFYMPTYVLHTNLLAEGKPELSALRHVIQIPFYILASYLISQTTQIELLGYLWLGWVLIDLAMLELISLKFSDRQRGSIRRYYALVIISLFFIFFIMLKQYVSNELRYSIAVVSFLCIILNMINLFRKKVIFRL